MPVDIDFQLEGFGQVREIINRLPELQREALREVAIRMRRMVRGRTPVGLPGESQDIKGSWSSIEMTANGFTFGTDKPYAVTLEEGLYSGLGDRTMPHGSGIFSSQAPGGMIQPILDDDRLMRRIGELVVSEMVRGMDSVRA